MDPYLESSELWSSVHSRLIVAMADDLVEHLNERYRVEVEKRVYFASNEDSLLVGIPDVAVAANRTPSQATATITAPTVQPEKVSVPLTEEVTERYLEIREMATGMVVTVIELLSPKNKRAGEGRIAYLRKRNQVLASASHLVEIDLLRGGQPLPISGKERGDYRILVAQAEQRPTADLYRFDVLNPIPAVPIPLLPQDGSPILDLQSVLNRVYQKGRYHLAIDYSQPAIPPLPKAVQDWLRQQRAG